MSDDPIRGRPSRRSAVLLVAASALAVAAVVVTPLALTGGNDDVRRGPGFPTETHTPSPSPTTTAPGEVDGARLATIPADLPLGSGYPPKNGNGTPVEVTGVGGSLPLLLCGREVATDAGLLDAAQATYTAAGDARSRDLVLYESGEAASRALATVRSSVEGCAEEAVGATDQVRKELPYDAGDESFGWTERYRTDGAFVTGLTVYQLARVGNALLLATTYGENGGPGASITDVAQAIALGTAPVVRAMDVFAEHSR